MTDLKSAIKQFAALLTDEAGTKLLVDAGLHEDSLADWHSPGFTETELRESVAGLTLTALFAKFQEIVEPALKAEDNGNLVKDGDDPAEYILREGADGAWIRIKNIDVRVYPTDEGVVVDLYPANNESDEAPASTWLTFAECESETEAET